MLTECELRSSLNVISTTELLSGLVGIEIAPGKYYYISTHEGNLDNLARPGNFNSPYCQSIYESWTYAYQQNMFHVESLEVYYLHQQADGQRSFIDMGIHDVCIKHPGVTSGLIILNDSVILTSPVVIGQNQDGELVFDYNRKGFWDLQSGLVICQTTLQLNPDVIEGIREIIGS